MDKRRLSQQFWDTRKLFQNRDSELNKGYILLLADKDDFNAYEWNQRHSKHSTVLCTLSCHVRSKESGILSVERN